MDKITGVVLIGYVIYAGLQVNRYILDLIALFYQMYLKEA